MAALAADRNRQKRGIGRVFTFPMAAVKIYKGAIVGVLAAGYATNAVSGATVLNVLGIAIETVDNSAGAAGDLKIRVDCDAEFLFTASSITQAMLGTAMLIVDNDTVDETSASSFAVGKLTEFVSTTQGWVYVPGLTI